MRMPATILVMSAKGTSAKTLGIETLFFSGIGGSLMRIKFKGMLENKINAALSNSTCEVDKFSDSTRIPSPKQT